VRDVLNDSYLLLYDELRNANLSVPDAIEGVTLARQLNSMKLEYSALLNESQRLKHENYYAWNLLEALKQEINSVSSQLEVLREAKDAVWNEIETTIQRSQAIPSTVRIRRRGIRRQHPLDMFHEH
jgi:chromosome segregation ATPase